MPKGAAPTNLESWPVRRRRSDAARGARTRFFPIFLLILAAGCAHQDQTTQNLLDASPQRGGALIFVADGAGNFQYCSKAVRDALHEADMPILVHTYEWSHGYMRILADQLSYQYAREEGLKMAALVSRFHADYPDMPIYLIGHSAGSTVILTCLENLPANTVERAFLLAPSLSCEYDIRPALKAVRTGMHVHYSNADWFYLGIASHWVGTADRRWTLTAGQVGFRLAPDPNSAPLDAKLMQRGWTPEDGLLGHLGGHYGSYQPGYLKQYILPYLRPTASSAAN